MSTSSKGAALERKAMLELEADGYLVHRTVRTPVMAGGKVIGSHNNDVFGVFDLVAMSEQMGILFVQVTTAANMSERRKKVETIASYFPPSILVMVEVWGWMGGGRKLDKRFSDKRYVRRQYWKRSRWCTGPKSWKDVTRPCDGWVDHGGVAP